MYAYTNIVLMQLSNRKQKPCICLKPSLRTILFVSFKKAALKMRRGRRQGRLKRPAKRQYISIYAYTNILPVDTPAQPANFQVCVQKIRGNLCHRAPRLKDSVNRRLLLLKYDAGFTTSHVNDLWAKAKISAQVHFRSKSWLPAGRCQSRIQTILLSCLIFLRAFES